MKVSTRLIIGFSVTVVLLWLVLALAGNNIRNLNDQFNEVETGLIPDLLALNEMENAINGVYRDTMDYVLYDRTDAAISARARIIRLREIENGDFRYPVKSGSVVNDNAALTGKLAVVRSMLANLLDRKEAGTPTAVLLATDHRVALVAILSLRQELGLAQTGIIERTAVIGTDFYRQFQRGIRTMFLSAGLITIIAAATALVTGRSIVRPLNALREGTDKIAGGNLNYRVATTSGDEIGELSRSFDHLTRSLNSSTTSIDNLYQEITRRQEIEEALRESEEKYRNMLELAMDGFITVNLKGEITSCNESFSRIIEIPCEEIIGQRFTKLPIMPARDIPRYLGLFTAIITGQRSGPVEVTWKQPDGRKAVTEFRTSLLRSNGKVTGIQAIVIDITARKAAEQALKESEERLKAYLESAPDGIYLSDTTGTFHYGNKKVEEITGYSREELTGKNFLKMNLLLPRYIAKASRLLALSRAGKSTGPDELELRRKDGSTVWVAVTTTPIKQTGETVVIGFVRDITMRKHDEDVIRREREKAQHYLDIAGTMLLALDTSGTVTLVNRKGADILGYPVEEIIGENWFDTFIPENLRHEIQNVFQRLMSGESEQDRHIAGHGVLTARGGEKLIEWHNSIIKDEAGNVTGTLSSGEDITERRKAEEALRQSEDKFSKAFCASPEAIAISNLETGTIFEVNDTFTEITGYSRQELLANTSINLGLWCNPDDRKALIKILKEKGSVRNREYDFRTKSGEIQTWLFSAELIDINNEQFVLSSSANITERKETEKALRESEERYRELIITSNDAIISIDKKMNITLWNRAAEEILGYKEHEILGSSIMKLIPERYVEAKKKGVQRFLASGKGPVIGKVTEVAAIRKDGEEITIELSVSAGNKEDSRIATAFIRDITERKQAEEKLRHLDEMKQEFLSNVSHELRTPLQSIGGFTKLLLDGQVPDAATRQEFLQIIDSETIHIGNLINSLLDMSRLEAGCFQVNRRPTAVNAIIGDSVKVFNSLAREKNIALKEKIPANLQDMDIDGARLRQVILNLISNAIKFSDPGTEVIIAAEKRKRELLFRVIDHGIGISPEDMSHLFERFYRAEDEKVRGGTGLGLYISRQIIEAHGGRIWAESREGNGSTFSFTLPLNGKGDKGNGEKNSRH